MITIKTKEIIFYTLTLLILTTTVLLASCRNADTIQDFYFPDGYNLTAFDVTGTNLDTNQNQAPLNPAENNGSFTVSWSVQDPSELYHVALYVSDNDNFSDTDIEFFNDVCFLDPCSEPSPYTTDCTFNNNNEISCAGDITPTSLTNFLLSGIPKDAYIIIRTCDQSSLRCSTRSHAVQFQ